MNGGEPLVIKKGYGRFANTPLDTILRNARVTTGVVAGVTTSVCVSTTVRGGVEYNYRMVVVRDAVAEVHREAREAELKILACTFSDVHTTGEVILRLDEARAGAGTHPAREPAPVEAV